MCERVYVFVFILFFFLFLAISVNIQAEAQDPASSWRSLIPVVKFNISTVSSVLKAHALEFSCLCTQHKALSVALKP